MTNYQSAALAIKDQIIADRRTVHSFAETGFDLPQTVAFVEARLRACGLEPLRVGRAGVSCLIGSGAGKTILLRADMDALPMAEQTGLPFAAGNGNCHSCGHDCHTAMLLGAARLLKEHESELAGRVKLMFQPAEELLAGARDMLANGILEHPAADAAMGLHVAVGVEGCSEPGTITYKPGCASFSGDAVRITITGKDAHGSTPCAGVDAINIAAHIIIALQAIPAREIPCEQQAVVLVGMIRGGTSCNTNAGSCVLEASIRADSVEGRAFLKQRVAEISRATAATFRGRAEVEFVYGMPSLYNDPALCRDLSGYCRELLGGEAVIESDRMSGSEDFTIVAQKVPSVFFQLGAGSAAGGHLCGMHNPGMVVEEDVLPTGAALYAHCAVRYLQSHS